MTPAASDSTQSDRPLLEVVICTYNNCRMLERTLETLAAQENPASLSWGVLIVDNNCTDSTPAVLRSWATSPRIRKLRYVIETEQGLTPARLCGVRNTNADWIAFVDDDCLLEPGWVASAAAFAISQPRCGIFGGRVVLAWQDPPPVYLRNFGWAFAEQELGTQQTETDCLVGAGMVVRRSALVESGWTSYRMQPDRIGKKLVSGGDVEIGQRIRSAGYQMWYVPECELRHVIPRSRTTLRYMVAMTRGLGNSQSRCNALLSPEPARNSVRASMRGLASEASAAVWQIRKALFNGVADCVLRISFVLGYAAGTLGNLRSALGIGRFRRDISVN